MHSSTLIPLLLAALLTITTTTATALAPRGQIPTPIPIPDPEPNLGIFVRPKLTTFWQPNDPAQPLKRDEGIVITPIPVSQSLPFLKSNFRVELDNNKNAFNSQPTNINLWICDAANMKGNCVMVDFPQDGYIMRLDAGDFWGGRIASLWVQEKGYCEVYA